MSADDVEIVVSILVSVNRPVTSEGLMSSVVPLPLPVEILAVNEPRLVPPLRTPPSPITHEALVPEALKLPLDWPKARTDPNAVIARTDTNLFICLPIVSFLIFDTTRLWFWRYGVAPS